MNRDPLQIRLSGRGGQGVILAGLLVAEAAMRDGLQVVQTQSYGPEARLGAAASDVILSEREIAYPSVIAPDILLCLSRDAFAKYGDTSARHGLRLVEERVTRDFEVHDALVLPILQTAESVGNALAANVVALGALTALSQMVSEESLRAAIRTRVKSAYVDLNLQALDAGLELAARLPTA